MSLLLVYGALGTRVVAAIVFLLGLIRGRRDWLLWSGGLMLACVAVLGLGAFVIAWAFSNGFRDLHRYCSSFIEPLHAHAATHGAFPEQLSALDPPPAERWRYDPEQCGYRSGGRRFISSSRKGLAYGVSTRRRIHGGGTSR